MAVIKANVQDNFVVITNSVAQDSRISLSAKGLILIMASRPPGWKFNKSQLMDDTGVGRDKLNSLFKELSERGFLAVSQNHDELGHFTNSDYYFFSDPNQNPAFIEIEPCTDLPYTEEPFNGESAPIKKESFKKKEFKQNGRQQVIDQAFEFFWTHYPKKTGKQKALSGFKRVMSGKCEDSVMELTDLITNYMIRAVEKLKEGDVTFLGYDNMNAATYLNQKRWEDEA